MMKTNSAATIGLIEIELEVITFARTGEYLGRPRTAGEPDTPAGWSDRAAQRTVGARIVTEHRRRPRSEPLGGGPCPPPPLRSRSSGPADGVDGQHVRREASRRFALVAASAVSVGTSGWASVGSTTVTSYGADAEPPSHFGSRPGWPSDVTSRDARQARCSRSGASVDQPAISASRARRCVEARRSGVVASFAPPSPTST